MGDKRGPRAGKECRASRAGAGSAGAAGVGEGCKGTFLPLRPHPSGDGAGLQSWRGSGTAFNAHGNLPEVETGWPMNRLRPKSTLLHVSLSPGSGAGRRTGDSGGWLLRSCMGTPHHQLQPPQTLCLACLGPSALTLASRVQSAGGLLSPWSLGLRTPWRPGRLEEVLVATDQLSHCCQQGFQNSLLWFLSLHGNTGCW